MNNHQSAQKALSPRVLETPAADIGLSSITISGQNLVINTPKSVTSFTYYDFNTRTYKEVPNSFTDPAGFKTMFGTNISQINNFFQYKATFDEPVDLEELGYYGVTTTLKCKVQQTPTYVGDQWFNFYSNPWIAGDDYGWSAIDHIPVNTASILSFEVTNIQFFTKSNLVHYYIQN